MITETLGRGQDHLYVTRTATRQFQEHTGERFEAARRRLTQILLRAEQHPQYVKRYRVRLSAATTIVATIEPQEDLLVVTAIRVETTAPEPELSNI